MARARTCLLLGATLGVGSVLMEWATYANSSGDHAFLLVAAVSLTGMDYAQWPYILSVAMLIGAAALGFRAASGITLVIACLIASAILTGLGLWLYVGAKELAYATLPSAAESNVRDLATGFFMDGPEQIAHIGVSPGSLAPLAAGLFSVMGAVLLYRNSRSLSPSRQ